MNEALQWVAIAGLFLLAAFQRKVCEWLWEKVSEIESRAPYKPFTEYKDRTKEFWKNKDK